MNTDLQQNSRQNIARRPAQKLLVVSENQELCLFLQNTLRDKQVTRPLQVDYRYTSFNQHPQPMIEIGAEKINVKDEATVTKIIAEYDLVFSLHCKQIFPRRLIENVTCINFHPGLNPYNRGWYPQVFSIINGLPVGATVHLMDAEVDHGEIIAQQRVDIDKSDTSLDVYRKVIAAEKTLLHTHVINIIDGQYTTTQPMGEGNYNGIQDYNALCKLDLTSVATLEEHLNLLRATTHGDFKNAYFTDEKGKKYFVRIIIEEDK